MGHILFANDSAVIRSEYAGLIGRIAADIDKLAAAGVPVVVRITGYTDRRGSASYNDALGLRRAKAIYEALTGKLGPQARGLVRVEIERTSDPSKRMDGGPSQ